ncbi:MAG: hypothetical protein ACR2IE_13715 [Candidatus Sumerlaeaceae bacterium]
MAAGDLGYWDYVKAAFNWKAYVPLLGNMPLNKFALAGFGILGFGNPGFWLLGLAYEAGYLVWLPSNERFQNIVRGRRLLQSQQSSEQQKATMLQALDADSRERYERLAAQCEAVLRAEAAPAFAQDIAGLKSEGLAQLLNIFFKLLHLRVRILETLDRTKGSDIEVDIKRLETAIANEVEGSPVQRALKGTLDIQKTRLENLTRSAENLRFTETELDRIEKQVSLISEEAAVSKTPEQWSSTLDGVVRSLQGTSKWMVDNSQLFESIESPMPQVNLAVRKAGQVRQ